MASIQSITSPKAPSGHLDGASSAGTPPNSPLVLVDKLIDAVLPLTGEDGGRSPSDREVVTASRPIIGHFTISDAVLAIGFLEAADRFMIFSGRRGSANNAAILVVRLLHKFICSGAASGPACAAARAAYVFGKESPGHWTDEDRRLVALSMAWDIDSLKWGDDHYWTGSLFGGGNIDPDEVNEPEDWWDLRQRKLSKFRECMGGVDQ